MEVAPGELKAVQAAYFTVEKYGPVLALAEWERGYDHPLYLISNLAEPYGVAFEYKLRFRIECFFSDIKTRGFKLDKSHLSDPERLNRLFPDPRPYPYSTSGLAVATSRRAGRVRL